MRARPIHVGEMTEPVELWSRTSASDGMGGHTMTPSKFADVWAHVRPLGGQERNEANRREASGKLLFVMRNRDDLNETHYMVWNSRQINIVFVRPRGPRDLYMEVEAEIGVPT